MKKKALEKFTGIKFKTINQFDTAIRKKSTDNISSLIKRIKGVDKELTIVSYSEILDLVSKNFKLNRDTKNDPQLEQFIIETQFKKMVDKLDKKDRKLLEDEVKKTAEEKFGKNNLDLVLSSSGFIAANLGGFATYTMATTVLGGFTSLLGITLPFAVYTGLTSAISILSGPIGLSILATWGIRKMTKPNIPVSILVVFSISAIRQRLIFEYEENKTKLDLEIKNLNQEKIKLENFYSNLKLLTPKNFLRKLLINNPKDTVLKISNKKL